MLHKVADAWDILPGGMKAVAAAGAELVLCNYEGTFYAISRACGHANARLERGALTGWILTCPLHYAQFDVRSGEALSGPLPPKGLSAHPDPKDPRLATRGLKTWPVVRRGGEIFVDIP